MGERERREEMVWLIKNSIKLRQREKFKLVHQCGAAADG
jgi:hypothetical protein